MIIMALAIMIIIMIIIIIKKRKKKNIIIIIIIIIVDEGPCDARVPLGVQHGVEGADDGPGRIEIER